MKKIQGEKGRYGRNNVIFTLSLAYFSSGYEIEECELAMLEFNDRLANPLLLIGIDLELFDQLILKKSTRQRIGGENNFAMPGNGLMKVYLKNSCLTRKKGRWKFKKSVKRANIRTVKEWAQDLLEYLNQQSYTYKPYIVSTKETTEKRTKNS